MDPGAAVIFQCDLGQVPARLWASFLTSVKWRSQIEMVWGAALPLLTSCGFFATPLLPEESPNIILLFLEPQAFLAPGPRPAAGRVLLSAVSSKGQPPLSMLGSPIHSMCLLAPGGLGRHTLPGGTVGGGWERPIRMPSVYPSLLTVSWAVFRRGIWTLLGQTPDRSSGIFLGADLWPPHPSSLPQG